MAIASAVVVVSISGRADAQLEREALHLASVLETARAEARAASLDVRWAPDEAGRGWHFVGLPAPLIKRLQLERAWLGDAPMVEIRGEPANGKTIRLGPEPLIGAQQVVLSRNEHRIALSTDGLSPFAVQRDATP